jgi:hypothetical protein
MAASLLHFHQLHPSILRPTVFAAIVGNRLGRAEALRACRSPNETEKTVEGE